jgi:hypothetical protein
MQLQKKVYVIKFVSDMWQVGGVLGVFSFDNTDCYDITEILLNVVLSTWEVKYFGFMIIDMECYFIFY